MRTNIQQKLVEVAEERQVEVLLAVESGSRAWGFASPDSDFDIRFIYKKPADYYLQLWDKPDTIEFMTIDDLDGCGWDLAKALKLLAKPNASLIEWLFSPEIYLQNDAFLTQVQQFAIEGFSPVATVHHYLGTSLNFIDECDQEKVKLKSYFYALRAALAAKWVVENDTFPPVAFSKLLPLAPASIQDRVAALLEIKTVQSEKYMHPKDELITAYLIELINDSKEFASRLKGGKNIHDRVEEFFKEEVLNVV